MASDHTQYQSNEELGQARKLSLHRTRPPTEVPGYETVRFLGSGAYGEVWVAIDRNTGRKVAIKFYAHRGGVDWSLLSREVEKLVFLSADRYVVQLLDVGWDADPPYYVMEYVENGSLADHLEKHGPISVPEALEIFREVAVGLSHAHGKGVLHCDLKPGNVLLDQDHKPRLADFGQSRLSHEQVPALGTLFYMAPEQADLEAVPDARWDVYALGALLHTMLLGKPPHQADDAVEGIQSAVDLGDRLARYRNHLRQAPRPVAHRKLPGMDRGLSAIMERCLEIDPEERFPSVHGVLEAVQQYESRRTRHVYVAVGLVGPALLLCVMGLFGWRGYRGAVGDSERAVVQRAEESCRFAAKFAAESVSRDLERYIQAIEEVAHDEQLIRALREGVDHEEMKPLIDPAQRKDLAAGDLKKVKQRVLDHPARQVLQQYVEHLLRRSDTQKAASWFAVSATGFHMAYASRLSSDNPTGSFFGYRTYFHGGPKDLPENQLDVSPLRQTHLSAVFQSKATKNFVVVISTPVFDDDRLLGVVALSIELGNFRRFAGSDHQFVILVDGREGEYRGAILEHPLFSEFLAKRAQLPLHYSQDPKFRVHLDEWPSDVQRYEDPLGLDPAGAKYRKTWIAAKAPVNWVSRGGQYQDGGEQETGWMAVVQQDYEAAKEPIHRLAGKLLRDALLALGVVVSLIGALWFFVVRLMSHTRNRPGRRAPSDGQAPLHSRETVQQADA